MPSTPVVVLPHVSAECTKNSVWQHLNGTNGKGPCEIANGLRSHKGKKCTSMAHPYDLAGNDPSVSPPYTGPSAHEATPCACSYEMYNAFSACAACQSEMGHNSTVMASWVSYKHWIRNCENHNTSLTYPFNISTSYPLWLSHLPSGGGMGKFNLSKALGPELSTRVTIKTSPVESNDEKLQAKTHSTRARLIGGILGGIFGLIVLICFLFWILRRRRQKMKAAIPALVPWTGPTNVQRVPRTLPITTGKSSGFSRLEDGNNTGFNVPHPALDTSGQPCDAVLGRRDVHALRLLNRLMPFLWPPRRVDNGAQPPPPYLDVVHVDCDSTRRDAVGGHPSQPGG